VATVDLVDAELPHATHDGYSRIREQAPLVRLSA
jgi:hypothetical protein